MRKKANASEIQCLFRVFVITEKVSVTAVDITNVKPLSKIYLLHKTWFTKVEEISGTASVVTIVARLCHTTDVFCSVSYLI